MNGHENIFVSWKKNTERSFLEWCTFSNVGVLYIQEDACKLSHDFQSNWKEIISVITLVWAYFLFRRICTQHRDLGFLPQFVKASFLKSFKSGRIEAPIWNKSLSSTCWCYQGPQGPAWGSAAVHINITMSVCAAPALGCCTMSMASSVTVTVGGFEHLLVFPSWRLVQTGWVLGRNLVELVGFSCKVGLGTGKRWGEVLGWNIFVRTKTVMVWRSWLSLWWKTSVLPPLVEGQMTPQYLVLTIKHKISFDLQFGAVLSSLPLCEAFFVEHSTDLYSFFQREQLSPFPFKDRL